MVTWYKTTFALFSVKRYSEPLYYFKYSFSHRHVSEWNSSLSSVFCESSLNSFKVSPFKLFTLKVVSIAIPSMYYAFINSILLYLLLFLILSCEKPRLITFVFQGFFLNVCIYKTVYIYVRSESSPSLWKFSFLLLLSCNLLPFLDFNFFMDSKVSLNSIK